MVTRSTGMTINRRRFLQTTGVCVGCSLMPMISPISVPWLPKSPGDASASEIELSGLHEAAFYKKLEEREIECLLCDRKCLVGDKERGYCGVRENVEGGYYTLVYGNPCSANIDPVWRFPCRLRETIKDEICSYVTTTKMHLIPGKFTMVTVIT